MSDDLDTLLDGPHAVCWAQRYIRPKRGMYGRNFGVQWTKWHWTIDANWTLCGLMVTLGTDKCPEMPQTTPRPSAVDCCHCLRKMKARRIEFDGLP